MIDKTSPSTRLALATTRSLAFRGKLADAMSIIDSLTGRAQLATLDRIVLLMAKAEYLHWDCRDTEALNVFQERIDALLPDVSD